MKLRVNYNASSLFRLVFSQSLLSLDLIEEMLALSTGKAVALEEEGSADENSNSQKWYKNVDYFRIDGSSLSKARQKWINAFNDEEDRRYKNLTLLVENLFFSNGIEVTLLRWQWSSFLK